ncbi:MAG: pre-toxin TG domain-containing protein, partial [Thermodesulfobacteriota bacterium]
EPYEREAVMSVVRPAANAFTTIMPGVSDLRDAYELLMGHDLHTGQALSMPQRALSGLGLVIGSGAAYREFGNVSGAIGPGREGTTVYRVWGDEAGAWGRSWTDVDPRTVSDYRNVAGLPNQNSGRFVSEGVLQNTRGITLKPADPLHGNTGGLSEIVIPNPQKQIKLQNVQGVNPEL